MTIKVHEGMAKRAGMDSINMHMWKTKHTTKMFVPTRSAKECYKLAIFIPHLDSLMI